MQKHAVNLLSIMFVLKFVYCINCDNNTASQLSNHSCLRNALMTLVPPQKFVTLHPRTAQHRQPRHIAQIPQTDSITSRSTTPESIYLRVIESITMPPKQIHGKGRTLAEPSFAQTTLSAFTDKENRSVVTAVGLFAVSYPGA
jgi:hypothetical protein